MNTDLGHLKSRGMSSAVFVSICVHLWLKTCLPRSFPNGSQPAKILEYSTAEIEKVRLYVLCRRK